ncbi:uncharacterized protein DUF1853 [Paraperlucidibaca baekdonensis]|uniref:Uncharacterized protein DUF1853 n=1 Tax=Paraperlucidibaca baekdonensis TaxID=748120 RepID=A0A3E0H6C0_9GAMM|nr:DUF1853 family protein [Paraperlucidibaca baekdonensis]REH39009.1 uncharacterized protein DUF1853 [Paraperlucidibaca baekdonensis]
MKPQHEPWLAFRTPAVRDLAWLIGTPPLLTPSIAGETGASPTASTKDLSAFRDVHWPSSAFFSELLHDTTPLLHALDADPAALIAHSENSRDFRLGVYVERLLGFWLAHPDNPRYASVAANIPVRDQGVTLGEMDYLVRSKADGTLLHLELAVKFYLGRPEPHPNQQWLGPGLHDRLDIKRDHLCRHQLALSQQPVARAAIAQRLNELGELPLADAPIARACWLKGRLFHAADAQWHAADPAHGNPDALRGQWRISAAQTSNAYSAIASKNSAEHDHPRLRGERLYQTQWTVTPDWPQTAYSPRR